MNLKVAAMITCFAVAPMAIAQTNSGPSTNQFVVEFGYLKKDSRNEDVVFNHTRTIPLRARDTGFRYGAVIYNRSKSSYTTYAIHKLPQTPQTYSTANGAAASASSDTMRTPTKTDTAGTSYECWFDNGDPAGIYEMRIYVNEALLTNISYSVTREPKGK